METLDEVIKRVIGVREDSKDLTPMDKGECKLVAKEWAKIQVKLNQGVSHYDRDPLCECKDEWLVDVRLNVMKCKKCGQEF